MIAYKGFDAQMRCRGFQYAEGETYEHDGPVAACSSGFHACEAPIDVFAYYPPATSRYHVVEIDGNLSRDGADSKIAGRTLTVGAEIGIPGLVKAQIEYVTGRAKPPVKSGHSTGNQGASSATGDRGASSATGDWGASSATGYRGASSATGYRGASSATGYRGASSATGDWGASSATGYRGASSATGYRGASSATGNQGASSATGDRGASSATGDRGASSATGDWGASSATGNQGAALVTGFESAATAGGTGSVAVAAGIDCKVRGIDGTILFLVERDKNGAVLAHASVQVGTDGIKADTWYVLRDGKVVIA